MNKTQTQGGRVLCPDPAQPRSQVGPLCRLGGREGNHTDQHHPEPTIAHGSKTSSSNLIIQLVSTHHCSQSTEHILKEGTTCTQRATNSQGALVTLMTCGVWVSVNNTMVNGEAGHHV